jgi:large conductance mechanosensitive channel
VNGFFKFVIRGNIIGLAVGVVIGAAFSALVSSFVDAFLTPLIAWATSSVKNYSSMKFSLGNSTFAYGNFIGAAITFVLTAAAIYFLIVLPVNKITAELNPHHDLGKAKRSCPDCLSQIPAKARRCSFCTALVDPILDEDSDKLIEETPGQIVISGQITSVSVKTESAEAAGA